jgi:hypothetical protein
LVLVLLKLVLVIFVPCSSIATLNYRKLLTPLRCAQLHCLLVHFVHYYSAICSLRSLYRCAHTRASYDCLHYRRCAPQIVCPFRCATLSLRSLLTICSLHRYARARIYCSTPLIASLFVARLFATLIYLLVAALLYRHFVPHSVLRTALRLRSLLARSARYNIAARTQALAPVNELAKMLLDARSLIRCTHCSLALCRYAPYIATLNMSLAPITPYSLHSYCAYSTRCAHLVFARSCSLRSLFAILLVLAALVLYRRCAP